MMPPRRALRGSDARSQSSEREPSPLGPFGFYLAQHSPTTRPSVERTTDKAFLLSDRVELSSAKARVEGIRGGVC